MKSGIDRRTIIRSAALVPFILDANRGAAECRATDKARVALVIGVDRPKVPQQLHAAASAADDVAKWLTCQGFEVSLHTDEGGKTVRFDDLYKVVSEWVSQNTVKMLVVYFAGHGYADGGEENWLLSEAPENSNELVGLTKCSAAARRQGIDNVVFISDACRSIKADLGTFDAAPRNLFPASSLPNKGYVDLILGSNLGEQTYEALVDSSKQYTSLFTKTFLSAYQDPPEDCVTPVGGVEVLPNRNLMDYLPILFQEQWAKVPGAYRQDPDVYVISKINIFIGAISGTKRPDPSKICKEALATATLTELTKSTFANIDAGHGVVVAEALRGYSAKTGYEVRLAKNSVVEASVVDIGATSFVVKGAEVASATAINARVSVATASIGVIIRVEGERQNPTLVLRFSDGSGALLPILPGYAGTVVVDERGISNISYLPSRTSWRFPGDSELERVRQLQVAAASAASFGTFRVGTKEEAEALGSRIRVEKSIDPTLGLYAAYAFEQASRTDLVRSVADYMRGDLGFLLFDVAMLAFGAAMFAQTDNRIAPPCPMLTQGWAYLDVLQIEIAEPLRRASAYLKQSLWTTFDAKGMEILSVILQRG